MPDKEKNYSVENSMPEESLNILLRRADWRFLLSNPHPKKSICYSAGLLASAVEFISESVIDPSSTAYGCDLAVAINPDQKTLQAGLTALRPGGYFYIEYNMNALFNPHTIRKNLELLGFDQIEIYLPKPPPEQPFSNYWIPLDSQGAVNFSIMMGSNHKTTPKIIRFLKYLKLKLWQLIPTLYMNYPWFLSSFAKDFVVCVFASRPKVSEQDNSNSEDHSQKQYSNQDYSDINSTLLKVAQSCQQYLDGNVLSQGRVFKLMLTQGVHSSNKIIHFVFSAKDQKPLFVLKTTRVSDSEKHLQNEADTLRALEKMNVEIDGIPKVLFFKKSDRGYSVAESFIEGTFLRDLISRKNYRELALKATDLLIRLADKTRTQIKGDFRNKILTPIISDFTSLYSSILDQKNIDTTHQKLNEFSLDHQYCEHRDFSPWNVLITPGGELGVLDWESSVTSGLPALDLIYFLTYLSVYLENASENNKFIECYSKLIDENTYTGSVFKDCVSSYLNRLGIDYSNINLLRLITWMIHAPSEYRDMGYVQDATLKTEQLSSSIFYNLWEYELTGSCRL